MTTNLCRKLSVGQSLSLDGGRIIVTLKEKSGRQAALTLTLADDVIVDKKRSAANDCGLFAVASNIDQGSGSK